MDLGQISALTLEQVKNGKATLQSNLSTLEMNLRRCKLQMQTMVGANLNGSLGPGAPAGAEPGTYRQHGLQAGPGGGQDPQL